MKQFNFNLEKILKLKKYYEDEAKIELGRAVSVLTDLENKIAVLGTEQARAAGSQFNPENDISTIQQYTFYLQRLENIKEILIKDAAMAEIKVEEARDLYMEASRERKVLDKVKEKRQKENRKHIFSEETKILDDVKRIKVF